MIVAIDPGSEKTGVAIIHDDGALILRAIVATPALSQWLTDAYGTYPFTHIAMGDGTNHTHLQDVVMTWIDHKAITFSLVDEKFTTVEGRKLYWKYTPRHGWRRFVPVSLQSRHRWWGRRYCLDGSPHIGHFVQCIHRHAEYSVFPLWI